MLGIAGEVETHPVKDRAATGVSNRHQGHVRDGRRTIKDNNRDDQQIRNEAEQAGSCQGVG